MVSERPSLGTERACLDVVAAKEVFEYTVSYVNNSSNDDDLVILTEYIPDAFEVVGTSHMWNAQASGNAGSSIPADASTDGQLVFNITEAIDGPLGPLQGGTFTITLKVKDDIGSGTLTEISGLGVANNAFVDDAVSVFTSCSVLVENADLYVKIAVDRTDPVPGDMVTYSMITSNRGAHFAEEVSVMATLPLGLSYVPGSTMVTTFGWSLTNAEPVIGADGTLTWSVH